MLATTLFLLLIVLGLTSCSRDDKTSFLKKYCTRPNAESNVWECSGLHKYPGGIAEFKKACSSIGYKFDCSGMCLSGTCYSFPSGGKDCSGSKGCESGWCKPVDDKCIKNCTGTCSEEYPPNICTAAKIFTFKAMEDSKVVDKQAGGALCD